MRAITLGEDTYKVPSTWDEMNTEQLAELAGLAIQREMPLQYMKVRVLLSWLGGYVKAPYDMREYLTGKPALDRQATIVIRRKMYPLTGEQVTALCEVCDFLFEPDEASEGSNISNVKASQPKSYHLAPVLTRNPYPKFWARGHIFHGPGDNMFDITFEQYIYICTYMDALSQDGKMLPMLLACLWHNRPRFEIGQVEIDARMLSHLGAAKQMVMYWFIASCMEQYRTMFPRLFSGEGKSVGKNTLDNQLRLLNSLADGDMTKKDAVRRGLLMDAFYAMDESVRQKSLSPDPSPAGRGE